MTENLALLQENAQLLEAFSSQSSVDATFNDKMEKKQEEEQHLEAAQQSVTRSAESPKSLSVDATLPRSSSLSPVAIAGITVASLLAVAGTVALAMFLNTAKEYGRGIEGIDKQDVEEG